MFNYIQISVASDSPHAFMSALNSHKYSSHKTLVVASKFRSKHRGLAPTRPDLNPKIVHQVCCHMTLMDQYLNKCTKVFTMT